MRSCLCWTGVFCQQSYTISAYRSVWSSLQDSQVWDRKISTYRHVLICVSWSDQYIPSCSDLCLVVRSLHTAMCWSVSRGQINKYCMCWSVSHVDILSLYWSVRTGETIKRSRFNKCMPCESSSYETMDVKIDLCRLVPNEKCVSSIN